MNKSDNIQNNEDIPKKEDISLSIENKDKTEESLSISTNFLVISKINDASETIQIKPEKKKSEFEAHIIEAYKIITGFYKKKDLKNKAQNKITD